MAQEVRSRLRVKYDALLAARDLQTPDGRPLYRYRFTREEYEGLTELLRGYGSAALGNPYGAGLFTAFAAEWFRRDRVGGAWDWIRPLAALDIRYDNHAPDSDVSYPEVRAAVQTGLDMWARPAPKDRSWILAVVREAGFPAAATRLDPRLSTWLKRSVLAIERGFEAHDAVGMESWRASERIVQALFNAAVALCQSLAALRASLPPEKRGRGDPVALLDARDPDWRAGLPFEVESRDVSALIDEVLRVRPDRSSALTVSRRLARAGELWTARARLGLSGEIEHQRMPAGLRERLDGLGRIRLVARGVLADVARPFAALERDRSEDRDCWEVRPLVATFDRPLSLGADLRLGALVGEQVVGEFVAAGGEAMDADAVVLEPVEGETPTTCEELAVIGAGSVRSRSPWLALAITSACLADVVFETPPEPIGQLAEGGRELVAFRGRAVLEADGVRRVWQAGASDERKCRLVLLGESLRGVREHVFLGMPKVWVEEEGVFTAPASATLRWRPRGRGAWRPLGSGDIAGRVEIAWVQKNEVCEVATAAIAPAALRLRGRTSPREMRIDGHGDQPVVARGDRPLDLRREGGVAVVDLSGLPPGGAVTLEFGGTAGLVLTLDDPAATAVLVDPDGRAAPRRTRLTVGRLHGWRLLAAQGGRMRFELARAGAVSGYFTRAIDGAVPLPAYTDEIRNLLGSADGLDVEVWLSWLGASDRAAEVAWYGHDDEPAGTPIQRRALALLRPQIGAVDVLDVDDAEAVEQLRATTGAGPWLVLGVQSDGEVLRPGVLSDPAVEPSDDLARAVTAPTQEERGAAFDAVLRQPTAAALRYLIDLMTAARREELPISALDAATALCRNPAAAVHALAACDSLEERAAVLALQRDLSLLWCATPVSAWLEAFSVRREATEARLSAFEIDPSEALRHVTAALAEIADLAPGVSSHVRMTFLLEILPRLPADRPPLDPTHVARLQRGVATGAPREILRRLASELLGRRLDVDAPPAGLALAPIAAAQAPFLGEFNEAFRDVVAAPYVAAALAAGREDPNHSLRARCRDAWLFDPDYFEGATPVALAMIAGGAAPSSVEAA